MCIACSVPTVYTAWHCRYTPLRSGLSDNYDFYCEQNIEPSWIWCQFKSRNWASLTYTTDVVQNYAEYTWLCCFTNNGRGSGQTLKLLIFPFVPIIPMEGPIFLEFFSMDIREIYSDEYRQTSRKSMHGYGTGMQRWRVRGKSFSTADLNRHTDVHTNNAISITSTADAAGKNAGHLHAEQHIENEKFHQCHKSCVN